MFKTYRPIKPNGICTLPTLSKKKKQLKENKNENECKFYKLISRTSLFPYMKLGFKIVPLSGYASSNASSVLFFPLK